VSLYIILVHILVHIRACKVSQNGTHLSRYTPARGGRVQAILSFRKILCLFDSIMMELQS
jgi:hypothetical protein